MAKSTAAAPRYRVDYVERAWVDPTGLTWRNEHRVVEVATGKVVLTFIETPDLSHAYDPGDAGVARVTIESSETHVRVETHEGEVERVAIPLPAATP